MLNASIRCFVIFVSMLLFVIVSVGCNGGSGSGSNDGSGDNGGSGNSDSPLIQVSPESHDFGTVTTGNTPAALEVKISNNGSTALIVSNITLSDPNNTFVLNLNGGSSPCGASSPMIAAGSTCTFEVSFTPSTDGLFLANVEISSDDSSAPISLVNLSGSSEPIQHLTVRINQVKIASCPTGEVTAYVSVTDQGGFPLSGLSGSDFLISLNSNPSIPPTSVNFVSQIPVTISIAAVMDYSESITIALDAVNDMEDGLSEFFSNLQPGDEGEIIKFDTEVGVIQEFTGDKVLLESAIRSPFDKGSNTLLYDAVSQAVADTGARTTDRQAVIVITDGDNNDDLGTKTLDSVISSAQAENLPIFPIGIGSNINFTALEEMGDETGGQFFESFSSDNVKTIYQQLSSILFEDQYILKFSGPSSVPAQLTIAATSQTITGSHTRQISCP
jgi:Ca-activated chloride channel homolog